MSMKNRAKIGWVFLGLAMLGLVSCGTYEERDERRNDRLDRMLDGMDKRADSRGKRFEKMKEWEDEHYQESWDRIMD